MYLRLQAMDGAWLRHYSWKCQPVDTSTGPTGMRVRIFYLKPILLYYIIFVKSC